MVLAGLARGGAGLAGVKAKTGDAPSSGQDELPTLGDAQLVLPPAVLDDDFAYALEQFFAANATHNSSNGHGTVDGVNAIRWAGRARRLVMHSQMITIRITDVKPIADETPVNRRTPMLDLVEIASHAPAQRWQWNAQ